MTASTRRPRRRAWPSSTIRWPSTGRARALTSSGMAKERPSRSARAWTARWRARVARGLGPQPDRLMGPGRSDHPQQVGVNRGLHVHDPGEPLQLQHLVHGDGGGQLLQRARRLKAAHHGRLLRLAGVAQLDLHEKPVQLRLRKREGALQLHRILGGDHHGRAGQEPGLAVHRHLALLHALQEGALGARHGPVDLVGEQKIGEDGPGAELELRGALIEEVQPRDVGGEDVRRELHAPEGAAGGPGEGLAEGGLPDTRHVLHQDVSLAQEGYDRHLDRGALAYDDPLYAVRQVAKQPSRL